MTQNKIIVSSYDPKWPETFAYEAAHLQEILKHQVKAVHHIGSTAVPGLAAKKDVDICLVVDKLDSCFSLTEHGYRAKGELNIPLRYCFSKNTDDSKVNLHVVEEGHHFISLNICFRDALRTNAAVCLAYQNLKIELANDPHNFERAAGRFSRYTLLKHDFINKTLDQAGYNDLCVVRCTHFKEWDTYHRIRDAQSVNTNPAYFDRFHPMLGDENHYHFVLLQGTTIVSAAHIECLKNNEAVLRLLVTDQDHKNKGLARYLTQFLERWLRHHQKVSLKMQIKTYEQEFYRNLGYTQLPADEAWDEPSMGTDFISFWKKFI